MEMMIPLQMSKIIDRGVDSGNMSAILYHGGIMVVLAFVALIAGYFGGKYGAKASSGFARNLREDMFRQIQTFSLANIDKFSTASLVTRMTMDITGLQNAYQMILRMMTRAVASIVVAMVMAFSINSDLARVYLVMAALLSVALFCTLFFSSFRFFKRFFEEYDQLNVRVQENVTGIRVVKSYVREDYEKSRFVDTSVSLRKKFIFVENILAVSRTDYDDFRLWLSSYHILARCSYDCTNNH